MSDPTPTERRQRDEHAHPRRRRAADRPDSTATAGDQQRPRNLFQRLRQPIIGLGLVGASFPLIRAQSAASELASSTPLPEPHQPASPDTLKRHAQDPEENIVTQIAVSREEEEREEHVGGAVDRYGIERDLAEDIYDIAREEGIDPRLAYGLVRTESTFDERAISHVGARGLTQVMPRTARWLVPGTRTDDLYNRQTNLRLGFRYLDRMIDKYRGDVRLALLAYNRGPGTVDKVLKRGGDPNNGYADKVLGD